MILGKSISRQLALVRQQRNLFNLARTFSTSLNAGSDAQLPLEENEYKEVAWGISKKGNRHEPMWIPRGNVGDDHVKFETHYCGVCHTDCHSGHNAFGMTKFPYVSGHEMVGKVTEVGKDVSKFRVGDIVGVGRFVDACLSCSPCNQGEEQYCSSNFTTTDGGVRKHGRVPGSQKLPTYGGYSASNVVHEKFLLKIPEGIPHESAGPILCAGVTMYSPLKNWGAV